MAKSPRRTATARSSCTHRECYDVRTMSAPVCTYMSTVDAPIDRVLCHDLHNTHAYGAQWERTLCVANNALHSSCQPHFPHMRCDQELPKRRHREGKQCRIHGHH